MPHSLPSEIAQALINAAAVLISALAAALAGKIAGRQREIGAAVDENTRLTREILRAQQQPAAAPITAAEEAEEAHRRG